MKKLLTLCLALAMTLSVGAYALTTLGSSTVKAADETATETSDTLDVNILEANAYKADDPNTPNAFVESWANADLTTAKDNIGARLISNCVTAGAKIEIKLETAVNASDYKYVTFKALYWADKASKHLSTTVTNLDGTSSINVGIYGIQSKSVSADTVWVKIPTSAIKNSESKVNGIKLTAPTDTIYGLKYFFLSDFTFTNESVEVFDYAYTHAVSAETNYGLVDMKVAGSYPVAEWATLGFRYNIPMGSRKSFVATVKFASPVMANEVDYYSFSMMCWDDKAPYSNVIVKNLKGEQVSTLCVYYNYDMSGDFAMRIPTKPLANEDGTVNGFILESEHASTNTIISEVCAISEDTPLAVLDEHATTTENNKWGFQTSNWAGVAQWDEYRVTYGGRDFVGSLYNIVLKYPVAVEKVKTIDFKAVLWNNAGVGRVQIAKLDGTNTEIINVNKGWTEVFEKNIDVKVNAELLADENGLVHGFRMNAINDDSGSFVFSKFTSGTEEKVYNATLTLADGTQENIAYTASNRAAKLAEVKAKLGTTNVQYTYSNDVPAELPFEEGKTYTETRTLNKYTVTFKNYNGETLKTETYDYGATPVAPETTPAKSYDEDNHYTFKGWDKEIAVVTGDVTYTAEFNTVAHVYGEWEDITHATCTGKGSHKKVCVCGKEVTEDVPANGHNAVTDAAVAPTCTEPGKTEGSHCSVCNEVLTAPQTVDALGHDMGEYVQTTAPTCTAKGVKTATCKREGCNHTETQEMDALGHDMGEYVKTTAPTCTAKGVKTATCKREGCNHTETQEIDALGHDMGEYVQTTAPTCTAKGEKTTTCKREGCNHTETQEIPAKGHTLEKVEKVAATESKEGVKEHYRCSECGDLFLDENGTTPATEADLKIAKLQKKGCNGSIGGLGLTLAAFGMAFVALKKKRG